MPILLQINVACNKGSTGRIAEQIALVAESEGWECYIAHSTRYVNASKVKAIPIGGNFSNHIHFIGSRIFDCEGLMSRRPTKKFIRQIKEIKPDIVHLHNIHGHYLYYPLLFKYLASEKIPVVWTMHDCWPFTGHCAYFDMAGCEKWKNGCFNCPNKRCYPRSNFMDGSKRNYAIKRRLFSSLDNLTLVPVSEWLGSCVRQSFLSIADVQVIHNGIDIEMFKPVENRLRNQYGLEGKTILLAVTNGFGVRKGLDDYIRLGSLLEDKYRLLMIGEIPKDRQEMLPKTILSFDKTNNQQELVAFYSMADVFLNLTLEDNYPTTNLEAIACGTPVITFRTGGSPEAVDNKTGIVVEKGDIMGVLRAIEIITKGIQTGESFTVDICRAAAESKFDNRLSFQSYCKLYNNILYGGKDNNI